MVKLVKYFQNIFSSLDNTVQTLNKSKVFAGLMIITLNIASRFVTIKMSKTMQSYLKFTFSRYILIFAISWMGTRDIYIALTITLLFIILFEYLLDEESNFYIFSEEFKDYQKSKAEDEEDEKEVSDEDLKKAEKTLERAKKQKSLKMDFQGFNL
jgi:uncharacterized membrane protein|tara:strand:+ start:1982 stop:2446 length:465 start_codon:yes stop_codon:yes gene_type:complete